ncbi:MAG: ATP-binding protein [Crocinitomicaceae bacterium]|nr:ATP-binding protein [Crocinitomicaceae bacterium]
MEKYPVLQNELARLEKLYSYNILEMEPEDQFDDLNRLTASILDVPICLITLMDADWQVFISNVGTDIGNHRELAFCQYCVVQENILEIKDATKDDRVSHNPLVANEPNIRYYVGAPLIDDEGFIIGTVCGYDVKPREMSEFQKTALKQITATVMRLIHLRKVDLDQKKYKGIFNLSQDILCILSKDGYLKEFNPVICKILDTSRDALLSKEFFNWVHPDDISEYEKLIEYSDQQEIRAGLKFRLEKSDGNYVTIEWSCYYDMQLSLIVVSGHDISDSLKRRSELEDAVQNANDAMEMKDQFLSDMSHEIRTPLASIVGFNKLLSTSNLTQEQKSFAETVDVASEHLMNIVNEVLDVYKFESHEVTLDPSPENLHTILDKIRKLYRLKAHAKGIDLILDYDERIPDSLNIDRTRLTQIISNLTSNAIKFTNEGSVTISAEITSTISNVAVVKLSVIDTGVGIEESRQEAIFERFTQENDATWRQYGGTGLGLSIAKLLVQLHRSKLQLTSAPDKGTTFSFEVPFTLSDLASVNMEMNQLTPIEIPSLDGLRILLAEDNKHLQILCKRLIERNKGEIHLTSNGEEAISFLQKNAVDVVLLDMQMPLINGMEAAKIIRNELKLDCPIIGCSANLIDVEYPADELALLDEFITKPYTEFRLISEILHQFESKSSIKITDDFKAILNKQRKNEGDALVDEFERIFKQRIPKDIQDLIIARKDRDFGVIKAKAHYLSTTLLTLKFEQGLSLSEKLDESALDQDETSTLMITDQFIDYLNSALKEI